VWAVTIAVTMASPSPVLPAEREREASPRAKRSNTCGCSVGGMPGPSSMTVSSTVAGDAVSLVVTVVPVGVWVRALASRFATTWCRRAASPVTITGSSGRSRVQWWSRPAAEASLTATGCTPSCFATPMSLGEHGVARRGKISYSRLRRPWSRRVGIGEIGWVVEGVDAGCLGGVQMFRCDPLHAAVGAHADGEAVLGDQPVIKSTNQAHSVDVGTSAVLIFV